ncbi:exopolysaccharide biosynthesis polyprenyl glycosylphosphotransferase [Halomicrobium sp. IBSBa]|uniref:exopolysaccharide biosynthesis polyprenyl glycosylphosphotransferase n=1 Tax=Halomicrobium sp. IBSBa TaxID=2778916 RepID=UPI001ABF9B26|nr:exopolysaccharide biosynthesis polyprenyl glycosylphosphotransferase [Halomicrobium sp. IBSBa]MBO4249291.1 exopolysaccharide biosynthesis polyprenyl glycosylphosphotransferase [Halomicrobium sp. IBSBa]
MPSGWRYRSLAICGTTALTALVVVLANTPLAQTLVTSIPVLDNLQPNTYTNGSLLDEIATTFIVVLGVLWPLFKPQPRRILDTIALTHKRVILAATVLATIGYFDWSTRLPRSTLILTTGLLIIVLPVWFVSIRRQPLASNRAIIVGDDFEAMETIRSAADVTLLGYVAPANVTAREQPASEAVPDGGVTTIASLPRLGGLSRLDEVLVEHDVDTVLLGFNRPDREEFFGALAECYELGVRAQIHRDHADSVLVSDAIGGDLVDTDLEPWDWQDYILKRLFDLMFSATGLLLLSPLIVVIALAVKIDSPGPVLYSQQRTAEFGDRFDIYKFRSMVTNAEAGTGARLSDEDAGGVDPRVTRVGRLLRKTHLDEIPQLWSVLVGDMSVVGPRPERPELDSDIESSVDEWRSRWFVKPGLTGLAQINDVTGYDPQEKIRYDIEYIRKQSFWFDLKIVTRQLYQVVLDAISILFGRSKE